MKIIILSPSIHSNVTGRFLQRLEKNQNFEVSAIIYRKIFGLERFKEQLNLGMKGILKKIIHKLLIPKILYLFNKKSNLRLSRNLIFFTNNFNDPKIVDLVKCFQADIIVFTGGGILKNEILNSSKLGILNCHLGILPQYRGMFPHIWAIYNKEFEAIGCTTHFMDEGIDTGPIIAKFPIAIEKFNFFELSKILEDMIPDCLMESLEQIRNKSATPELQNRQDGFLFKVPNNTVIVKAKINFAQHKMLSKKFE